MHYYIDGYNLLFRVFKMRRLAFADERRALVELLSRKIGLLELDATLVFDSHYVHNEEFRYNLDNLAVVYTHYGESADEFIVSRLAIAAKSQRHTVVTSDRTLGRHARAHRAQIETVENFIHWLDRRYVNKMALRQQQTAAPAFQRRRSAPPQPAAESQSIPPALPLEYYLFQFEKRLQESSVDPQSDLLHSSSPKKQKKNCSVVKQLEIVSDTDRWTGIFEQRLTGPSNANGWEIDNW
jgi:hypothetical protein